MTLDLPLIFMLLMGLAILAYVVLDGFDLGVGILLPLAPAGEQEFMVAAIGPFWDANETWLVLGVGILLVAFPLAHGAILGQLYLPVAVMLLGLILRGVAFEFRVKASGWHQVLWNRFFFAGSLLAALAQGYMLGAVVTGFRSGAAFALFNLLVGAGLAGGYALLGGTWLLIKNEGSLHRRAIAWSRIALIVTALGVIAISLATPLASPLLADKWFRADRLLWLASLPIASAAAIAGIWRTLGRLHAGDLRREWLPFVLAVWIFVFAFAGLSYSLFPYLILERMDIWQAAAAPESLRFVFTGTCIVLPLVLGYTVLSYRVFWGKARKLSYGA